MKPDAWMNLYWEPDAGRPTIWVESHLGWARVHELAQGQHPTAYVDEDAPFRIGRMPLVGQLNNRTHYTRDYVRLDHKLAVRVGRPTWTAPKAVRHQIQAWFSQLTPLLQDALDRRTEPHNGLPLLTGDALDRLRAARAEHAARLGVIVQRELDRHETTSNQAGIATQNQLEELLEALLNPPDTFEIAEWLTDSGPAFETEATPLSGGKVRYRTTTTSIVVAAAVDGKVTENWGNEAELHIEHMTVNRMHIEAQGRMTLGGHIDLDVTRQDRQGTHIVLSPGAQTQVDTILRGAVAAYFTDPRRDRWIHRARTRAINHTIEQVRQDQRNNDAGTERLRTLLTEHLTRLNAAANTRP